MGGRLGQRLVVLLREVGNALPQCPAPAGWTGATGLSGPSYGTPPGKPAIQVATRYENGELYQISSTLPEGCAFQDGSGVAKGGKPTEPQTGGYCVGGETVTANDRTITYTAPAA